MFICEICGYKTEYRERINEHHIVSRELGGSNKKYNLVYLCLDCHNRVYIPLSNKGHSIKREDSIEIIGWVKTTEGRILHYIENGVEKYGF